MTTPPCRRSSWVKKSPGKSSIEGRTHSGLPWLSCSSRRPEVKSCPSSKRAASDEACCRWKNANWTITNTGTSQRRRRRLLLNRGSATARFEGREKGDPVLRVATLIESGMVTSRPYAAVSGFLSCPGSGGARSCAVMRYGTAASDSCAYTIASTFRSHRPTAASPNAPARASVLASLPSPLRYGSGH